MPSSITLFSCHLQPKEWRHIEGPLPARVDGDCFKRLLPLKTNVIPVYLYAAAFSLFLNWAFYLVKYNLQL